MFMQANSIEQEMYNYFTQLNDAEQKRIAEMLKTFLKSKKPELEERIGIVQYNKEIDEAMAEAASGEIYTHKKFMKMMRN